MSWRQVLTPAGTRWNMIARRVFVVATLMVLSGAILAVVSMLVDLESAEWLFLIVFWFGIALSIPALVAIVLTAVSAREKPRVGE